MSWTNDDGLEVLFGTEQANDANVGAVQSDGIKNKMIVEIDYSAQAAVGTNKRVEISNGTFVPSGAIITKATFDVDVAFTSGGAGTLDLGFMQADGTALDVNGIDAVIALAAMNTVGDQVACDGAMVNGVKLTANGYPSFNIGTAAMTAGQGTLTIEYLLT